MTRNQVRFALGTPLLVDPFRADRWDYFYSYMKGGDVVEQRRLVVFFKDDKLDRLEGDVIAAKPVPEKIADDKAKPVAATVKPDAVKLEAAKPVAKPEIAKPAAAKPADTPTAAALTTSDGAPVGSGPSAAVDKPVLPPATKPDPKPEVKAEAKPAAAKPALKAEEKPKEERGFFGRLLDRIGL
jgi:outer membrane protein assembly factor BamE